MKQVEKPQSKKTGGIDFTENSSEKKIYGEAAESEVFPMRKGTKSRLKRVGAAAGDTLKTMNVDINQ